MDLFPRVIFDDFDDWWSIVPRKVGRKEAQKCYRLARKFHTGSFLKDSMIAYAHKRKDQDMRFTLHPSTWLRQERWNDEEPILSDEKPQADKIWSSKVFIARMGLTSSRHAPSVMEIKMMLEKGEITKEQAEKWPLVR